MSKQPPPAPIASAVGPCPTVIQNVGSPEVEVYPAPSHNPMEKFIGYPIFLRLLPFSSTERNGLTSFGRGSPRNIPE